MTDHLPPSLARLAAANPVAADARRAFAPGAQADLARILASERDRGHRMRWPRRRRVVAALIIATALAGCGAALRAADPFGFWRSAAPGTARYGVNPAVQVVAPSASEIGCRLTGTALSCRPGRAGIRYDMISQTITAVPRSFTRRSALRAIATGLTDGRISATAARILRADIAALPDSFFAAFAELARFQTIETGYGAHTTALVPPHAIPLLIACAQLRATIECRNLNGDEHAPVGAGIYAAAPTPGWVRAPAQSPSAAYAASDRLIVAVLGHPFTAAELRFLIDSGRYGTVSHSGGIVRGHSSPAVGKTSP